MVINVGLNGDALDLDGFDPNNPASSMAVPTFQFADGTVMASSQLLDLGFTIEGTSADEVLTGTAANNTFIGHGGNDTFIGGPATTRICTMSGTAWTRSSISPALRRRIR